MTAIDLRRAALCAAAFVLATAAPVLAAGPACPDVPGATQVVRPGTVVLLGELHGTAEAPRATGDLACHAVRTGAPVVVGLELPRAEQARLDAFLASGGGAEARAALLGGEFWRRDYQDGRTSRAMAELVERLRALRAAGGDVDVLAIDEPAAEDRDEAMAAALAAAIADARPEAIVIVLTGNLHNRLTRGNPWNPSYQPMGLVLSRRLPDAEIVSLELAHAGGTAWFCAGGGGCGEQRVGGSATASETGIVLLPPEEREGTTGRYRIGPITASPPAVAEPLPAAVAGAADRLFRFEADPRIALHHLLYQWARAEAGRGDEYWQVPLDVPERTDAGRLTPEQRARWEAALDVYRRHLIVQDLPFADDLLRLKNAIVRAEGETLPDPGFAPGWREAFAAALPVYRGVWWPAHRARSREWIETVRPLVDRHGDELSRRIAAAYDGSWPDEPIRVDVSPYASYHGAYTSTRPNHVTISSAEPSYAGVAGLEMLFHESSHTPSLTQPLLRTLDEAFGDREPPRDLWHVAIFLTAGELTRQALTAAGSPGYVRYATAQGLERGRWKSLFAALDSTWIPYLRGETTRDAALAALVAALASPEPAGKPQG